MDFSRGHQKSRWRRRWALDGWVGGLLRRQGRLGHGGHGVIVLGGFSGQAVQAAGLRQSQGRMAAWIVSWAWSRGQCRTLEVGLEQRLRLGVQRKVDRTSGCHPLGIVGVVFGFHQRRAEMFAAGVGVSSDWVGEGQGEGIAKVRAF